MPIYEYQCVLCGHTFDQLQKISEEPLKLCPECHQPGLQKLVSAAGFQLKGTGWYATDFRNKGQPKAQSSPETEPQAAKTDTETKTNDTTTGTTTESKGD